MPSDVPAGHGNRGTNQAGGGEDNEIGRLDSERLKWALRLRIRNMWRSPRLVLLRGRPIKRSLRFTSLAPEATGNTSPRDPVESAPGTKNNAGKPPHNSVRRWDDKPRSWWGGRGSRAAPRC